MATRVKSESVEASSREIGRRWTPRLVHGGWTPISDYFLENYHRLEPTMSSLEAMLVIHLMKHKWDERHPHPAFKTIATRMGVSPTAVRNHARSLEKKRYLNRIITQGAPNQFDLTPLFDALERLHMADEGTGHSRAGKARQVEGALPSSVDPLMQSTMEKHQKTSQGEATTEPDTSDPNSRWAF